MKPQRILLLLGGTWHKFDPFAAYVTALLAPDGHIVEATRDFASLRQLAGRFDVVMSFTCLSANKEDGSPASNRFSDALAQPLADFVSGGGAYLAVHCATVACQDSAVLRQLTGGVFLGHPPAFNFTVYPMHLEHPITAGVGAFSVFDEFYQQQIEPDAAVHMIALDRGVAWPMVWSRTQGKGRVAHLAPGHDERVWNLPAYQRLVRQAVGWLGRA